jgi:hypothetical protein
MELSEAISRLDARKFNGISRQEKIRWLSDLDGMTYGAVIATHRDGGAFTPYTPETPGNTELLIPAPHEMVYLWYMEAMVDYACGEFVRYNNAMEQFTAAYRRFADSYHRQHSPVSDSRGFH